MKRKSYFWKMNRGRSCNVLGRNARENKRRWKADGSRTILWRPRISALRTANSKAKESGLALGFATDVLKSAVGDMAPPIASRLLFQSARRACGVRHGLLPFQFRRAASSKHPKNFVAPNRGELEELRETAKEFTRELIHHILGKEVLRANRLIRARDTGRSRSEDGSTK